MKVFSMIIDHFKYFWSNVAGFRNNNKFSTNRCFMYFRQPIHSWNSFVIVITMNVNIFAISNNGKYNFSFNNWKLKICFVLVYHWWDKLQIKALLCSIFHKWKRCYLMVFQWCQYQFDHIAISDILTSGSFSTDLILTWLF